MNNNDYQSKLNTVNQILQKKEDWKVIATDGNTGRITIAHNLGTYKVILYTSRMTLILCPVGEKQIIFKRQTFGDLKAMLKNPERVVAMST